MYKLIIPLVALGLTACNSTSDKVNLAQCTNNNWADIGYETALSGKSVRFFNKFEEQCGEKLAVDAKSHYLDGFTSGIKEYCTYDNGFKLASKSLPNKNTCPYELRSPFDKGYKMAALVLKEQKANLKKLQDQQDADKRYQPINTK